jgi:hypothetical protein
MDGYFVGSQVVAWGFFTQEKYILGKTGKQLEKILGYKTGRLDQGFAVFVLDISGENFDFMMFGYTMVAEHQFGTNYQDNYRSEQLKNLAIDKWSSSDRERVVKVVPFKDVNHPREADSNRIKRLDKLYPHAAGVPQWKLTSTVPAMVVAVVENSDTPYYPAF